MAEYEYDQERGIPTPTGRVDIVRSSPVCVVTAGGGWIFQSQPSVSRAVLTLTARELECRDERPGAAPRTFLLEDLVGVDVNKLPFSHNKAACQMNVHTYPLLKKSAKKRKMVVLSVGFDSKETFEDNRTTALGWKKEIQLYSSSRLRQVLHNIEGVFLIVYIYCSTVQVYSLDLQALPSSDDSTLLEGESLGTTLHVLLKLRPQMVCQRSHRDTF